jgi:cytochrome c oxidase subunit 2
MPTFQGQVSEEDIIKLIAFIKSLRPGDTPFRNEDFPAPVGAPTQPTESKQ